MAGRAGRSGRKKILPKSIVTTLHVPLSEYDIIEQLAEAQHTTVPEMHRALLHMALEASRTLPFVVYVLQNSRLAGPLDPITGAWERLLADLLLGRDYALENDEAPIDDPELRVRWRRAREVPRRQAVELAIAAMCKRLRLNGTATEGPE